MIDHLVHLYSRGSEPFRSLSDLPDVEAIALMRSLYRPGSIYWDRFAEPAHYLQARRAVEQWLRQAFIAKGGKPKEPYPVYMVLGRTRWMETALNALTQATTAQVEVPLALFGPEDISFTYPDSMVSAMLASEKDPAYYLPEYHGKLFTLPEILALLQQPDMATTGDGRVMSGYKPDLRCASVTRHTAAGCAAMALAACWRCRRSSDQTTKTPHNTTSAFHAM